MCGLLGILTSQGDAGRFVDTVARALPCMRHRGPDEDGTWNDGDVVFGFNRLSIIDLEHSHQPLQWDPEGSDGAESRYSLTFNGEIYNYLELREELEAEGYGFHTDGDSETIVVGYHHWGADVVNHLRGMFAFAVWDAQERTMFLGRDPFGIKPLFYATTEAGTVFGSEKKSILAMADDIGLAKDLDDRAIAHYTDLQYVPEPETLHAGIRRVESGCHVTLTPGGSVEAVRYFEPTFPVVPVPQGTEDKLFHRIADAMKDSVAKHMRADVTVGSFL
ncbi:MAG: asparagine synthetase B family protein, partial [Mycobacteriaceae bacterium]